MNGSRGPSVPTMGLASERGRGSDRRAAGGRGRRFREIVGIARRHGLLPWTSLDFTTDPAGSALRTRQADGLRRALEEAGGAFVKLGQILSTRSDMLPDEWTIALATLQRDVEPAPWADVEAMLVAELGRPLTEVFVEFDHVPVAAASLGQVHRARLPDGRLVAVKVLRPGIEPAVRRDVAVALRLVDLVARASPRTAALGVRAFAEQYGADLIRQLDFRLEAMNLLALTATHSRSPRAREVRLPHPVEELSSGRVLVLEYIEGDTLSSLNRSRSPLPETVEPALRAVMNAFVRHLVFDGVYHSDLHPGNVMIDRAGVPVLIDFGSVGRLDLELRESIQELLVAYLQGDNRRIADGLLTLASLDEDADEVAFRRELSGFISLELGPGARVDVATVDALLAILTRYGLRVPAELVAAGRGFAILEGTLRSTLPGFDLLEEARSIAGTQIRDRLEPRAMMTGMGLEMLSLLPGVRRLPRRIDRIGGALESGDLSVNIRMLADRRDRRLLSGLVRQLLLTGVGSVAGISSLGYLTTPTPDETGVITPAAAGIGLAVVAVLALAGAAVDVFRSRRGR